MREEENPRLVAMSDLGDAAIREGDPDVRGWRVRAADGSVVGAVDDLIVDTHARRARYLRVRLDDGGDGKIVIVPVGVASIDPLHDDVFIPSISADTLHGLEPLRGPRVERDYEVSILHGLDDEDRDSATMRRDAERLRAEPADEYYGRDQFDEERFYAPRRKTKERELMESMAVTGVSDDDEAPEIVGEVRGGLMSVPIIHESGEEGADVPPTREDDRRGDRATDRKSTLDHGDEENLPPRSR